MQLPSLESILRVSHLLPAQPQQRHYQEQKYALFFFYKNQVYKNVRLQIVKNLRTFKEHWKASFLQKFKYIELKI